MVLGTELKLCNETDAEKGRGNGVFIENGIKKKIRESRPLKNMQRDILAKYSRRSRFIIKYTDKKKR